MYMGCVDVCEGYVGCVHMYGRVCGGDAMIN